MTEIQRYHWTRDGMKAGTGPSHAEVWVKNSELAAQAEGHAEAIREQDKGWGESFREEQELHRRNLEAQAEEHRKELAARHRRINELQEDFAHVHADLSVQLDVVKGLRSELAALRGAGEPAERLEYIARDLARLLLVSARSDITEFRMNRSTYAWLVERANA